LPTARLFTLIFLIAINAAAQEHIANRMPSEIRPDLDAGIGFTPASAPAVSIPDAPSHHRVIDKKFVAVLAALGGAESMRFTSRKLVLDNEFAAGAPWVTSVTPNQQLVVRYAGVYAAELLVAYELKKPHSWLPGDRIIRKFWWAYPAAMATLHIKNSIGNIRTQGPGGCTSIQCAEQMPPQ
jgi:hypothetical protein